MLLFKTEKMKNLIVFALFLLSTTFAFAQKGTENATNKIQKKIDRMTEKLDLSAEQQEQIKDLYTEQQEVRMATKQNKKEMTEEEKVAFRTERKSARKDFNEKLNNILTAEQQEMYKGEKGKNKAKAKGKHKKGKMKGKKKSAEQKAERRVAKLSTQLNLSTDQQQQMMDLMMERAAEKKAVGQAKKESTSKAGHEALRAERKVEKANYQSKFEAILTAEQLAIHKKNQTERKAKKKLK